MTKTIITGVPYCFDKLAMPLISHWAHPTNHLFGILNLVIEIYLKFDFWCLEFP